MAVIKHSEQDKLFFYNENDSLDIETAKVNSISKRKFNFIKKKIVYILSFFKIKRKQRDLDYIKLSLIKYIHKNRNIFNYTIYKNEIIYTNLFMDTSSDPLYISNSNLSMALLYGSPYITNIEVTCSGGEAIKLLNKFKRYFCKDELSVNIEKLKNYVDSRTNIGKRVVFIKMGNPGIYFSMEIYMRLIINLK